MPFFYTHIKELLKTHRRRNYKRCCSTFPISW